MLPRAHTTSPPSSSGELSKHVASGSGWEGTDYPDPEEVRRSWDEALAKKCSPQPTPKSREELARENRQARLCSGWASLSTLLSNEELAGSGWLSSEDIPRGVDDRGLTVEGGLAAAAVKQEEDVSVKQEDIDDEQWDPVGINLWLDNYLDFCEVVRVCATGRDIFHQPIANCTRLRPCVRCKYHVGATLPSPQYWASLPEDEISEFIVMRVAQRMRRDAAIRRSRLRPVWPAPVSPRSRSPPLGERVLAEHLPRAFSPDASRRCRLDVTAAASLATSEPASPTAPRRRGPHLYVVVRMYPMLTRIIQNGSVRRGWGTV